MAKTTRGSVCDALTRGHSSIIRNAAQWCRSGVAVPSDFSLTAYVVSSGGRPLQSTRRFIIFFLIQELQRILSRCLDFLYSGTETPSGLQVHCDYMLVIKTFETQVLSWREQWIAFRRWEGELFAKTFIRDTYRLPKMKQLHRRNTGSSYLSSISTMPCLF